MKKMKLKFLGTRGNIEERTKLHYMHSSLMVYYYGKRVTVDCGQDWLGGVESLDPLTIVLTHAHPDHSRGLKKGVACPIHPASEIDGLGGDDLKRIFQKMKSVIRMAIKRRADPGRYPSSYLLNQRHKDGECPKMRRGGGAN